MNQSHDGSTSGAGLVDGVMVFCQYYLPGYKSGGPTRAVANIVDALGGEVRFHIVTRDRDYLDPSPYVGVTIGDWSDVGPARVYYVPPGRAGRRQILHLLRRHPRRPVYVNSFFDPLFSVLPLWAMRAGLAPWRPVLIAPRGEFSPNALRIKPGRKWLYRHAFRAVGLAARVHWHTTTDHETRDLRRELWSGARVTQVPDLPGAPRGESGPKPPRASGPLRLLFLSRTARMKNLIGALEVLRGVPFPVAYHLYGPIDEEAYWNECRAIIATLPAHVTVEHHGPVPHHDVGRIYREHDFFFLPTLGENFGHVIVEALTAGCPVILSDKTPWRGLRREGVGWDVELGDVEGFRRALIEARTMDDASYEAMAAAAQRYGLGICRDEGPARAMRALLASAALEAV